MRKRLAVALVLPLLLAAPGTATADVIFDPADADDLAATLADAYTQQNVCYGWDVTVDNVGMTESVVGSNFGAGKSISSGDCDKSVEFQATITYTSESSESEDSASYDVTSNPTGVTRDDLDSLGIDFDGLTGEDPDVPIGKAIVALPLLAADAGLADPIVATPDTAEPAADAQLTDDPGSDFWRDRGGMLLWGIGLLIAGGLFLWWVLRSRRPLYSVEEEDTDSFDVPDSVPAEWEERRTPEPPTEPFEAQSQESTASTPEPEPEPEPSTPEAPPAWLEKSSLPSEPEPPPGPAAPADEASTVEPTDTAEPPSGPESSTADSAPERTRPASSDRQDKE